MALNRYTGYRGMGFFITNKGGGACPVPVEDGRVVCRAASCDGWDYSNRTSFKFADDKCFYQDGECAMVLEGVETNKAELFEEYGCDEIVSLVKAMRAKKGETFFANFRGSFSGAYLDRASGEWTVWTNHYGDSCVFYAAGTEGVYAGSVFWDVLDAVKGELDPTLCEHAVTSMLTYGFMNDDSTYASEVKRLLPGHYLTIGSDGTIRVRRYWHVHLDAFDLAGWPEERMVDELDRRFRHAVDREFGKDAEYGYRHLAGLSGGLDSRMVSWVAHDLGYEDVVNITYSQAGYLDETVAEEVSKALHNESVFMQMDDAGFMTDLRRPIEANYGLTLYFGPTGMLRFLELLDTDKFGLLHEGSAGDSIVGSHFKSADDLRNMRVEGLYSDVLADRAREITDLSGCENMEEYFLSVRAFMSAITANLIKERRYTPVASPFVDVDFFEFMLSVPIELRGGHSIYRRWVCDKYPEAAAIVWEAEGVPLTASPSRRRIAKITSVVRDEGLGGVASRVSRKLGMRTRGTAEVRGGMNPLDQWAEERPEILETFEDAFTRGILHPALTELSRAELREVFVKGGVTGKAQALTVVETVRMVFS